jgi:creatinine amidohydrolase
MTTKVRWAELFPDELLERIKQTPIVYLPMGLCEPHGHIAVMGLDTIKADYLCDEAANRFGGIVAPTQGYQIHEAGYHAPWLEEVVGEVNTYMTSLPPHVMLYFFLYQLRAFHNAGFKAAIIISGHSGGNQNDFRLAASFFEKYSSMKVRVFSDPELVSGKYTGDHAGKYEISQLQFIKPEFINLGAASRSKEMGSLGRFAQGEDCLEASAKMGKDILEESLTYLNTVTHQLKEGFSSTNPGMMQYDTVEKMWAELKSMQHQWETVRPKAGQVSVSDNSRWKPYEYIKIQP